MSNAEKIRNAEIMFGESLHDLATHVEMEYGLAVQTLPSAGSGHPQLRVIGEYDDVARFLADGSYDDELPTPALSVNQQAALQSAQEAINWLRYQLGSEAAIAVSDDKISLEF